VKLLSRKCAARAFLPRFRERRSGVIVNVTSVGGLITMPGIAYYCGSKFALKGISEVMRAEMVPFGVHVTALRPGSFRMDWAGCSIRFAPRGTRKTAGSWAVPQNSPPQCFSLLRRTRRHRRSSWK